MRPIVTLDGGALWQWDIGRTVTLHAGTEAHFALEGAEESYTTLPDDDGHAEVPNVLTQAGRDIAVWASDGEQTVGAARIVVRRRAKPSGYAYTATDVESVESIATDIVQAALAELQYADLNGLPTIEGTAVVGDLTWEDFGLLGITTEEITAIFESE